MQVDKNCNATGATTQNIQLVAIDGKHANEDGKPKDAQQQPQQQNAKSKQQTQTLGNDSYGQALPGATGAASTPVGQTQSQIVSGAAFEPTQQQHNAINRMITNIVQQSNGTKVQKIASESMIPTTRSGAESPHKSNAAGAAAAHHGKHQQNNSTSFPTNATKADGKGAEKTTYGRLRVLTAPPTSVHEIGTGAGNAGVVGTTGSEATSPRDAEAAPFLFDMKSTDGPGGHGSRRSASGGVAGSAGISGIGGSRRSNLRSSSGCGSTQRLSGGNRDHSVTQFALIDDENVSALQQVRFTAFPAGKCRFIEIRSAVSQVTRGGALTLASQWKSQFDDSEETTDNEWKQEPQVTDLLLPLDGLTNVSRSFQSPDHRDKSNLASHGQNVATAGGKASKRRENKRKK